MSKGFLIFAQNIRDQNYIKQAYALALSIKATQKTVSAVALMTNDRVPDEYLHAFDAVVDIPWGVSTEDIMFSTDSRWKIFHVTPFDETIVLDSDMLMLEDVSQWWNYLANYDVHFCSRIRNFRGEVVTDTVHRKAFIENELTNPYFALHYFKKSDLALDFYKTVEFVIKNWEWHYTKFAPKNYQPWVSMDLSSAIAIEILGIQEHAMTEFSPLEFTHMKAPLQGWNPVPLKWTDPVHYFLNSKNELMISNIKQRPLLHYIEKDFITSDMLTKLRECANV